MLKRLSSPVITVVCLTLLLVLTFWGTIAQVQQGLYAAQDRFFNSFFFLAAGFFPFPGAQLVLWVLLINLVAMLLLSRQKYSQLKNIGLLITHAGLLLYFVAAFLVFHAAKESSLRLAQGQTVNTSVSYHDWEIADIMSKDGARQVRAVDSNGFKSGMIVPFSSASFTMTVNEYYPNSTAFTDARFKSAAPLLNASGITKVSAKAIDKERSNNIPGVTLTLKSAQGTAGILLYGGEEVSTNVTIDGETHGFQLRRKTFPLPFTLTLNSFKAEFLPGTDMAKNYESEVTLKTGALTRQARIYMNNPLKYKDYTVYQSSYDTDSSGRKYSTLAVVKNFAKGLPYVACIAVFLGLALHYLLQAFAGRWKI